MCGFCGYVLTKRKSTVDFQFVLDKMTDILAHRGPDSKGLYHTDTEHATVGLGHRRLSIIDLSKNANQPLGNDDDSIMVVFNGEIYNYKQLTKELKEKGHKFRSQSDTEVIVHLYEDMQAKCLEKLDGMFAFALWDNKRNRLLLSRDRLGIKPLYYAYREIYTFDAM